MAQGFEGFGGFGPNAKEVKAKFDAGVQAALQSGDPDQMRAAVMQQAANTIAPPKELRDARKRDKVLRDAFEGYEKSDDELEDQINYMSAVQAAALDAGLPEVALQATTNIANLRLTQEERGRLRDANARAEAQDKRDAARAAREEDAHALAMSVAGRYVVVDGEGNYMSTIDMKRDPEGTAAYLDELKQAETEHQMIKEEVYFAANAQERLALAKSKINEDESGLPATTQNRFNERSAGNSSFVISMDQLADLIDQGPGGLSTAGKGKAVLERLGSQGRQFAAMAGQSEEEAEGIIANAARKANIDVALIDSAVINLAYALASSRESGKLSESDVELALQTLGVYGQPDPAAALTVLRSATERNARIWEDIPNVYIGFDQDEAAMKAWRPTNTRYQEVLNKFDTYIDKWSNKKSDAPAPPPPVVGTPTLDEDLGGLFGPSEVTPGTM